MSDKTELAERVAAFLAVAADFPDADTVIQARNPAKGTRATLTLGDLRAVAALLPSAADEPVAWQYRVPSLGGGWMKCDRHEYEARTLDFNHGSQLAIEWRALFTRPASARPSAGATVEWLAEHLWHRFGADHEIAWPDDVSGRNVSEYRAIAADVLKAIAAAPVAPAAEDAETCEGGAPECGPVVAHDSEGVPLCQVCWDGLVADSAAAQPGVE